MIQNPVEMTQDAALRLHSFEMHASKHEAAIFHALVMMLTSCLKCKSDVLTKFELLLHCNCGHDYVSSTIVHLPLIKVNVDCFGKLDCGFTSVYNSWHLCSRR